MNKIQIFTNISKTHTDEISPMDAIEGANLKYKYGENLGLFRVKLSHFQ